MEKTNDTRPAALYLVHPTMDSQVVRVAKGTPGFWPIKRLANHGEAERLAAARIPVLEWLMFQHGGFGPIPGQVHHFAALDDAQDARYALARF